MSHTAGDALGAVVVLRLSVAAVFWLCGLVHFQRLVFGGGEISDVDVPVDGAHVLMAAYMALLFFPGYSGRTDRPAAAAFLLMAAALGVRAVHRRLDRGPALQSAMAAAGGAGMACMLVGSTGTMVAPAMALLVGACATAHLHALAGTLQKLRVQPGSPVSVSGGHAASTVMATGMVIMLLQM